jgi:hypothetical protein
MRHLFLVNVLAALALSACSKSAGPGKPGNTAQEGPQQTPAIPQLAGGADQQAIRRYLESVKEIKAKKFDVQWNPDVIPVSREEAARSLREISPKGDEFTLASSEAVVKKLEPGRIIWIWGVALRRIDRVGVFQDATIVHTSPVSLNAAMIHADIQFDTPLDFGTAYGGYQPPPPKAAPPPAKAARLDNPSSFRMVGFRRVLDQNPADQTPSGDNNGTPNGAPNNGDNSDSDELNIPGPTTDGFTGKIAGFEYSIIYNTQGSTLSFEMQARKEEEGGGEGESNEMLRDERKEFFESVKEWNEDKEQAMEWKEKGEALQNEVESVRAAEEQAPSPNQSSRDGGNAELAKASQGTLKKLEEKDDAQLNDAIKNYNKWKGDEIAAANKARKIAAIKGKALNVFLTAYDNLDVRFRTKAEMDRAALEAAIQIDSGKTSGGSINFKELSGRIDFEFIARLGRGGNAGISVPVAHVPVALNIPLVVGGVPFVAQFGGDFLIKAFWSGKHATHHFAARYEFKGGAGMLTTDSKTDFNNSLSTTPPEETGEEAASSPGTSGTVFAFQTPRIGLGLGFVAANAMAFFDYVTVLTITNSAGVASLNPQCKRLTLDRSAHFGVDVNAWILPMPIGIFKKELWHDPKPLVKVEPDIPMCRI